MSAPTPSRLDHQQCIQGSYDESTGRLRVDAAISASIIAAPGLEVSIQSIDDNIAIRNTNNNNELLINSDGSINTRQNGTWTVQQGTPPWSVSQSGTWNINNISGTISLPTGASTSSLQTTGNTSLASIDSKLPNLNTTPIQTIQLFTKPYDSITVTYPSGTQEVYASRVGGIGGTVQQTATVNYVDSTKANLLNVAVV